MNLIVEIENISGFTYKEGRTDKFIKLSGQISRENFTKFLVILRKYRKSFSIYDGLYPSMSDPGAYISYSQEQSKLDGYWSMTLGNHGWSGGLYHVKESIIIEQLFNLRQKNMLNDILIDNGIFLSNINYVSVDRNDEINNELLKLHEG